jgi:hypothetical protein
MCDKVEESKIENERIRALLLIISLPSLPTLNIGYAINTPDSLT